MSKYRVVAEGGGFVVESWAWWCPVWQEIAPLPPRPRFGTIEEAKACIARLKTPAVKNVVHQE